MYMAHKTQIDTVSDYFDYAVNYTGDLKSEVSSTKYFYYIYDRIIPILLSLIMVNKITT